MTLDTYDQQPDSQAYLPGPGLVDCNVCLSYLLEYHTYMSKAELMVLFPSPKRKQITSLYQFGTDEAFLKASICGWLNPQM
jgi:hypothetical protein